MTRHLFLHSWEQHALVFGVGLPELLILLVLVAFISVVPLALLWAAYALGKQRGAADVRKRLGQPD